MDRDVIDNLNEGITHEEGEQETTLKREGLTEEEIEQIPTTTAIPGDTTCCICLVDIQQGAFARQLACKHLFHSECLVQWVRHQITCPLCRHPLTDRPGFVELDFEEMLDSSGYDNDSMSSDEEAASFVIPITRPFDTMSNNSSADSLPEVHIYEPEPFAITDFHLPPEVDFNAFYEPFSYNNRYPDLPSP